MGLAAAATARARMAPPYTGATTTFGAPARSPRTRLDGTQDRIGIDVAGRTDDQVGAGVLALDVAHQSSRWKRSMLRRLPITG